MVLVLRHSFEKRSIEVIYVGQSKGIHRRMVEHKNKDLAIDKFVREQSDDNDAEDLRVKWIKETNPDTKESKYIKCIAEKLGYCPDLICVNSLDISSNSTTTRNNYRQ